MKYAEFGTRFVAHVLDNIISIFIILGAVGFFLGGTAISPLGTVIGFLLGATVFVGGLFLNEVYFVSKKGSSLGKKAMGIKIVDKNKNNLSIGKALGRVLIKDALFLFSILGALVYSLPILASKEKQSIADMILSSYVVDR